MPNLILKLVDTRFLVYQLSPQLVQVRHLFLLGAFLFAYQCLQLPDLRLSTLGLSFAVLDIQSSLLGLLTQSFML